MSETDIERYNREQKWINIDKNRGSRYPPFSIEPLYHERMRLDKPMTDEQRALRREWVKAQILAPDEPGPYYKPMNIFRRIYTKPWNMIGKGLAKIMPGEYAFFIRWTVPKGLLILGGMWWAYYAIRHHPMDWTRIGGARVSWAREFESEDPHPAKEDFADYGFKSRKVLLNAETSAPR